VIIYGLVALLLISALIPNLAASLRFEDALIVLRYARNLAGGEGFVFNVGERVLGVTTPLHTLISSVFIPLGLDHAPTAQNISGLLFLVLEGGVLLLLCVRLGYAWLGLLAAMLTVTNFNLNYLYIGMEAHQFAFCILLAFVLYLDGRQVSTGVVLGVAFLYRYDAALMAGLIGTALLIERRRFPARLAVSFLLTVLPWLVFAQLYFGSIIPEPLGAKQDAVTVGSYLMYVFMYYKETFKTILGLFTSNEFLLAGFSYLYPVALLAGAWELVRRNRRFAVLAAYPVLHVCIYAFIGSDPLFTWHYYILNPVVMLFAVFGVFALITRPLERLLVGRGTRALQVATAVGLILISAVVMVRMFRNANNPYQRDPHTAQLWNMAEWLEGRFDEHTTLLQPSIGILGWVTNMRMIDHAGLVTPGLFYFDDQRCTPIGEVVDRFSPDLVLLNGTAPQEAVVTRGYEVIQEFKNPDYVLFANPALSSQ